MAGKLKDADKKQLKDWIGTEDKDFELLYCISRDGCNATTFHQKCDNQGPTVTVVYNQHGSIYGGYTSVSWAQTGVYVQDPSAFLYSLYYSGNSKPAKFPLKDPTYSVFHHQTHGPTFGGEAVNNWDGSYYTHNGGFNDELQVAYGRLTPLYATEVGFNNTILHNGSSNAGGHDLQTFTGAINNWNGTYYTLNGSFNAGHSYDISAAGGDLNTIHNGNSNTVTDLEVYLVKKKTQLKEPWRKCGAWSEETLERLQDEIEKYAPLKELKLSQVRILMMGPVGAGKSSFFNTINSVFRGHITCQAGSGSAERSLTTLYRMYQIRSGTSGSPLNFRLCDTRGIEDDQGLDPHEINYFLDGNISDRHQFNPSVNLSPETPGFNKTPTLQDRIHCMAYVIDASTFDVMPERVLEKLKGMETRAHQKGVPQVVLLTKVDRVCEATKADVSAVFLSTDVEKLVDKVSQAVGLPRAHILPVKNYENEGDLDTNVSILALLTLRRMLSFADDYLYNVLDDPETENVQKLNIKE